MQENDKLTIRTIVLIVLAGFSLVANVVGDLMNAEWCFSWGGFLDSLLTSAAHLTLNGFEPLDDSNSGTNLIRGARYLALVFVVIAAGFLLESMFHFVASVRRKQTSRRQHDLIIGLGWHGQELLKNTGRSQTSFWHRMKLATDTIAIDPNPGPIARELCEKNRIPLLQLDARGGEVLHLAGIDKVRRIFVAAGSDDVNIESVYRFVSGCSDSRETVIAVNLQSGKSFQVLQDLLGQKIKERNIDLHMFSATSSTAKALFSSDDYQLDRFMGATKKAHLVLIGDGLMGKDLLRHALLLSIFEIDASLDVDVLCPDGIKFATRWSKEFPCFVAKVPDGDTFYSECELKDKIWLNEKVLPKICFHDLPDSSRGLVDWCDKFIGSQNSVTTVIVAIDDLSNTCDVIDSIGEKISSLGKKHTKNIELWVYFNSRNVELRESFNKNLIKEYPSLCPKVFSDYLDPFSCEVAVGSKTGAIAKRVNAMHSLSGIEYEEMTSAQEKINNAWKEISESDKESSRLSAAHASIKKRIRERLNKSKNDEASSSQELSRVEHRRWCAEYLLKGFEPLIQPKKNSELAEDEKLQVAAWFPEDKSVKSNKQSLKKQKRHIDLVPFDDLTRLLGEKLGKKEQNKDRDITLLDWVLTGEPRCAKDRMV